MTHRYTSEIGIVVGPTKDTPAPDVNTNEKVMAWMMDTYSMNQGSTASGVVTGKPISLRGSLGRQEATGRGMKINGARIAVQGFGDVGGIAARVFVEADAEEIRDRYQFRALDCNILIPAALEQQITEDNANKFFATIILEGENGLTTPEAHDILCDKGVLVVPKVIANAGGVTVGYFGWVQDISSFFWTEDEINLRLKRIVHEAFSAVWPVAEDKKVSLRTAAFIISCTWVLQRREMRGFIPDSERAY